MLYVVILGAGVLFLSYKNTSITSIFKEEGELGTLVTAVIMLVGLASLLIFGLVSLTGATRQIIFWIKTFTGFFVPVGVLLSLYVPKVNKILFLLLLLKI